MMNYRQKILTATVAATLICAPAPAVASESPTPQLHDARLATPHDTMAAALAPLPHHTPNMGITNDDLLKLVGTQDEAEIDAIRTSGLPAVLLADDDGNVIAAAVASKSLKFPTPTRNCIPTAILRF